MNDSTLDQRLDGLDAVLGGARRLLLGLEVGGCDVERLGRVRKLVLGLRNTLDGVNADLARRAAELRRGGNSKPTDDAMNPNHRQPSSVERGERERGDVFEELPGLENATKAGELSGRYGDIVARALRHVGEEVRSEFCRRHQDLVESAKGMSEHRFRLYVQMLVEQVLADCGVTRTKRQRRNRKASSWSDIDTGMWNLRGSWDPETGAQINTALEAEVNALYRTARDDLDDRRTRPQMLADAVANLLCGNPTSSAGRNSGGGATVLVITNQPSATAANDMNDPPASAGETASGAPMSATGTTGMNGATDTGDVTGRRTAPARQTSNPNETTTATTTTETATSAGTEPTTSGTSAATETTAVTGGLDEGDDHTGQRPGGGQGHRQPVHEYGDGTPIAVYTLDRLLDDPATTTLPVMVNEHGVVTAVGDARLNYERDRRLATWAQRFALRAMHRTCLIPGCDIGFSTCEIHHLLEWERGGCTNLDNLAPLCVRRHHLVHAEGWVLRLDPTTRELTIIRPDGITETHPFTGLAAASSTHHPPTGQPTNEPEHPPGHRTVGRDDEDEGRKTTRDAA